MICILQERSILPTDLCLLKQYGLSLIVQGWNRKAVSRVMGTVVAHRDLQSRAEIAEKIRVNYMDGGSRLLIPSRSTVASLLVMMLVLALVGCATAIGLTFQRMPNVPTDQGVVYIYRPSAIVGLAVAFRIAIDGEFAGEVRNAGYLPLILSPGIHVVNISPFESRLQATPSSTPLDINVTAGGSHYVRMIPSMTGPYSGKVEFQGIDERAALEEISTLRLSE